jgi:Fe-S oxidoreductase
LLSADVIMADGTLGMLGERSTLDNPLIANLYSTALKIREQYADPISRNWPRTWRNSAGYRLNYLLPWSASKPSQWDGPYPALHPSSFNLHPLLAGSEGTLAVLRRAKVRLVERPKSTILAVLQYQSNADACDDVPRLLTHHPSAVELIPRFIIRQARSVPAYARQMGWVVGDPAALLVVEFSGDDPQALKDAARRIGDVLTIAESGADQARIWNVRKVGLGLLDSRPQSPRPVAFIEDCAIPVEKLGEFVREVEKILSAHATEGGIYAHASAGCLHIRPILDLKTAAGVRALRSISESVFALTVRLEGAMSSEHGDGLARAEYLEPTYGPDLTEAMRMLKRAADPHNLLNPGKILDSPKMDQNLRYGAHYKAQTWASNLSFIRNGGLDIAIEQCNGQGVCRKDTGVMCPSYQATRDEMHSTRGRANLLRGLIRSRSAPTVDGLLSYNKENVDAAAQALDLCLACKGCKSECPSGVDMAKLKFAFQAEYYKTHRRQLRDYVFGYFHITAGFAAAVAPLSNAMMEMAPVKNRIAQVLGITQKRPFPKFTRRRAKIRTMETHRRGEKIIFLTDVFSRYIEPTVEQAAFDILSQCGYDVHVLPIIGAGASFLSKGFVDLARRHAGRVLDALNRVDPNGEASVVGIEPPEIYCLKHDYADLLAERGLEIRQRLEKAWLLDELLLRSERFNNLRVGTLGNRQEVKNSLQRKKVLFHPHCHQRAEAPSADGLPTGTSATVDLLRLCGFDVDLVVTGCCGMAGTFGYEAEHYDLSMEVGELKLFPILRDFFPEPRNGVGQVLSSGAACRMQIEQGTGVQAIHPLVRIAEFLQEGVIHEQT